MRGSFSRRQVGLFLSMRLLFFDGTRAQFDSFINGGNKNIKLWRGKIWGGLCCFLSARAGTKSSFSRRFLFAAPQKVYFDLCEGRLNPSPMLQTHENVCLAAERVDAS